MSTSNQITLQWLVENIPVAAWDLPMTVIDVESGMEFAFDDIVEMPTSHELSLPPRLAFQITDSGLYEEVEEAAGPPAPVCALPTPVTPVVVIKPKQQARPQPKVVAL